MSTVHHLSLLQNMPVFGAVSEDTLAFIIDRSKPMSVARETFFFRDTDDATSMFVIQSGRVAVLRERNGQPYQLAELGPGDCFGEMALIECAPRSASVQALEDCTALELGLDVLHALYEHDLEQFVLIQMNLAREVSRRLRSADEQLFSARVAASDFGADYRWFLM